MCLRRKWSDFCSLSSLGVHSIGVVRTEKISGQKYCKPEKMSKNLFFVAVTKKLVLSKTECFVFCTFAARPTFVPDQGQGHRAEVRSTLAGLSNYQGTSVELARLASSKQASNQARRALSGPQSNRGPEIGKKNVTTLSGMVFRNFRGNKLFSVGPPLVGNGDLVVFEPVLGLGHIKKFRAQAENRKTQFPGARGTFGKKKLPRYPGWFSTTFSLSHAPIFVCCTVSMYACMHVCKYSIPSLLMPC